MKQSAYRKRHIQQQKSLEQPMNDSPVKEELSAAYNQLKATEDQLIYTENKFRTLIENMSDIFWIADLEGRIQYINDVCETILGYDKEMMIGHRLFEFMCPLHKYEVGSCVNIVAQMAQRDFIKEELWMLHSDGHTRKVLEVNTRRVTFESNLIEIQGVARDITERIRLERKIKSRNKQLSLLNEISSAIAVNLLVSEPLEIYEQIGKKLVHALELPLLSLRLISEAGQLEPVFHLGTIKGKLSEKPMHVDQPELQQLFFAGEAKLMDGFCRHLFIEEAVVGAKEQGQYRTLLIPMLLSGEPLGLLAVCFEGESDPEVTTLLSSVAFQLVLAIEKVKLYQDIKHFYVKIIKTLIVAMEAKDIYTQGHSVRVSQTAMAIGKALGLSEKMMEELEIAGLLHDIGKIGISDAILTKAGTLTAEEYAIIKQHPEIGRRILDPIGFSEAILEAVLHHHKRFDLTGYPDVPTIAAQGLFARIIGVADAYDAMTSNRSYKTAMDTERVIQELNRFRGTQFCPEMTDLLLDWIQKENHSKD